MVYTRNASTSNMPLYSPSSGATGYNSTAAPAGTYRSGLYGWYHVTGTSGAPKLDVGSKIAQSITYGTPSVNKSSYQNYATVTGSGTNTASATVIIPYNYTLTVSIGRTGRSDTSSDSSVVYAGGNMAATATINVRTRNNTAPGLGSYATITKDTHARLYFYITDQNGNRTTSERQVGSFDGRLNTAGSLTGNGGTSLSGSAVIPDDTPVGYRACIRVEVSPADSHDNPSNGNVYGDGGGIATSEGGSSSVHAATCYTVAKKPTFSVEGGNLSTTNPINTSRSERQSGNKTLMYGSWAEYGVIAPDIFTDAGRGFASGAAFAYETGSTGLRTANSARNNNGSVAASNNICVYSSQTFANTECTQGYVGYDPYISKRLNNSSGVKITNEMIRNFVDRIEDRYKAAKTSDLLDNSASLSAFYDSLGNDKQTHVYNAYNSDNSDYNAGKTVTITRNIVINSGTISSLDDLKQAIIFAGTVNIAENVTQIDAIIIADKVNTCTNTSGSSFFLAMTSDNNADSLALNAGRCNSPLIFNAPVVTNSIELNRTYGGNADTGLGDIANNVNNVVKRAEIFNLRPDMYLWAFGQMQNSSQAVTTYSRELPVRY